MMNDKLLFALLVSLFCAACAPALSTPTPAPSKTVAPTTTALPTSTSVPTATPKVVPTATPTSRPTLARLTTPPTLTPIVLNAPPARMTRYAIDQAKHPQAVCNDGSTPILYYRRGSGDGARKWVFWFKGGGNCADAQSCAGREHGLISSVGAPPSKESDGILSHQPTQNPDFYNWNHVLMHYCTSDDWTGARQDRNNAMGWYFRGHYVTNAIVDAMMDDNLIGQPTLREATHVLLTGSSAGAHGLLNNADRLAKLLAWADVRAVSDAGLGTVVNPSLVAAFEQGKRTQWEVWKPVLDESCLAANPTTPTHCLDTHLLINDKHITTPLFMRQDFLDPVALEHNQLDFRNPAHRSLIEAFATTTANILQAQSGAFGTAKRQHVMLETEDLNAYRVNGMTFAQVLGNWYFNRNGPKVVVEVPEK